jgi:hypothetical protein
MEKSRNREERRIQRSCKVVRSWMNPPPRHQESTRIVDNGQFEPTDHFGDSGFVSLECKTKSLVTLILELRKGFSKCEISTFRYFRVWHSKNSDEKESGPFALKILKSRNMACLWSGISTFRLSRVQEVEEAVTLESRVSNSRFAKSRRGKGNIPEKIEGP